MARTELKADKTTSTSLVERAYAEIKRRIFSNEYPPGFQALEQEVASQLGMSRTPVREALIRLENERLVELVPRRGMRVVHAEGNLLNAQKVR